MKNYTLITSKLVAKFYANIKEKGHCWEWQNVILSNGYGKIQIGKHAGPYHYHESAHRFSYRLQYGEIPEGKLVCHKCDNKKCVNPFHLFLGTQNDNMQDMIAKGRKCCGENVPNSKLKESDVIEIRTLFKKGIACKDIASKFKLSNHTTRRIIKGLAWRHVNSESI